MSEFTDSLLLSQSLISSLEQFLVSLGVIQKKINELPVAGSLLVSKVSRDSFEFLEQSRRERGTRIAHFTFDDSPRSCRIS